MLIRTLNPIGKARVSRALKLVKLPIVIRVVRETRTTAGSNQQAKFSKHFYTMLNSTLNPEVCDATDAP